LAAASKKDPRGPYADKLWREALRRQVLKRVEKEQNLDRLAVVVFAKALDGDMVAAKEIGDRLDGRPAQAIVGDNERDPVRVINEIRRTIVDPAKKGS
jgi:hypothetical protein